MRRPSTTAPAGPATAPRRADVTDVVSPVFGSATDSLYFCELLADSDVDNDSELEADCEPLPDVEPDCDNDSERETDWLIELEYEPLADVEPDWLIELEYEPLPDVDSDCD